MREESRAGTERVARVAGLKSFSTPSLEAVERRRLQLWILAIFLLLVFAGWAVALTLLPAGRYPPFLTPQMLQVGLLVLVALFSAYVIEKELSLQRLTELLVREKILTASLKGRVEELASLLEAGRAVNLDLDLDQVLERILDSAVDLLGARGASIMLVHAESELRTVCVVGRSGAMGAKIRLGDGIAGRVAEKGEPLLIDGTTERSLAEWTEAPPPPLSAMSAPLEHRGRILGVINVNAEEGRRYTEHDLRALSIFGTQAASAIANAQLFETQRLVSSKSFYHSLHDGLTTLPNRELFLDRVEHALARRRADSERIAVLFIDLDNFKRINDSLGHGAGDEVLVSFARRLQASIRSGDTAARFGGDEFAVLMEEVFSTDQAIATCERIRQGLRSPFAIGDREVRLRTSIGVAIENIGRTTAEEILRNADTAVHVAKTDGKDTVVLFEESMHADAMNRLDLESELQHALRDGHLEVHYQPIHELAHRRPVGVEALLRWNHPTQGLLDAGAFVPIAHQVGILPTLDRWVLGEACRTIGALSDGDLSVYVNCSAERLQVQGLVEEVAVVLGDAALSPSRLVVEITENAVLGHSEEVTKNLRGLRALGVRIAVDDFGTGYSSLSYFRRFPVDAVKIDRVFVDGLARETGESSLVEAIVRLGQSLTLEVIAEGLEEEFQIDLLREMGCELGQGWILSRVFDPKGLQELLAGEG